MVVAETLAVRARALADGRIRSGALVLACGCR